MKRGEILEGFGRSYYSYRRRDDDEQHYMDREKRDFKRNELQHELGHESNNIQVVINGKPWKVFPGKGRADSPEEYRHLQSMKTWAEKKSAATGKDWKVYLTGASPTVKEMDSASTGTPVPGKVQKVNPDGTVDVVDNKGTVTPKIDPKTITPDPKDPNKLNVNVPQAKLQPGTNVNMTTEQDVVGPRFAGIQQTKHADGGTTTDYQQGPMRAKQKVDAQGRPIKTTAQYDLGVGKLGSEQDHVSGIRTNTATPADPSIDPNQLLPTDSIAAARGVDPKKFAKFQKQNPSAVKEDSALEAMLRIAGLR